MVTRLTFNCLINESQLKFSHIYQIKYENFKMLLVYEYISN